jgi:hypothetical protein
MMYSTALAALFLVTTPASTHAQNTEACSYEQCSMLLGHKMFSSSLVQGVEQEKLASLRFFAPIVPEFAARSDTAAAFYAAFRGRQNRGFALALTSVAAVGVGIVAFRNDETATSVITIASFGLLLAGIQQIWTGQDRLSQAVWRYNSTLTQP